MVELRALSSVSALALEFTILTTCRTSELLEARWGEIDGDVWTLPAARMTGGKERRVPLSLAALAILERVRSLSNSDWVFPSRFSHLSANFLA